MKPITYLIILIFGVVFNSCSQFEYDPNQSVNLTSGERLNYTNIEKINSGADEKTTFIVTGDSHLQYDYLNKLVNYVNKDHSIDFVIHLGDITDHGLLKEFEWATDELEELNKPFVVVIGNHDVVANGERAYEHMFGQLNFSFIVDSVKFVFFNSNSREYGFNGKVPDLAWVEKELSYTGAFNRVVLASHVPYWDKDFDLSMKDDLLTIINNAHKKTPVLATLNGHLHNINAEVRPEINIPSFIPGSVKSRTCLKVTIINGVLSYEKLSF
ncbi:MAG: hypothetical protein EAY81_02855 [Bacteroidetes bacterium]|nr:MAG: hypothetical protein EAY81_02855 [Bacteroidota bacterium]